MDPISLIALVLALFVGLKLRSILGVKDETTQQMAREAAQQKRETQSHTQAPPQQTDDVPEAFTEVVTTLKQQDPDFTIRHFLEGTELAYEMVCKGFEQGDLRSVSSLLHKNVRDAMEQALSARDKGAVTDISSLVRLQDIQIEAINLRPRNRVEITVFFTSEQLFSNTTHEKSSTKIVHDHWVFARTLGSKNPNWKVIAT